MRAVRTAGLQVMKKLIEVVRFDHLERIQRCNVGRTVFVLVSQIQEQIFMLVCDGCCSQQHSQDVTAHLASSVDRTVRNGNECLRKSAEHQLVDVLRSQGLRGGLPLRLPRVYVTKQDTSDLRQSRRCTQLLVELFWPG